MSTYFMIINYTNFTKIITMRNDKYDICNIVFVNTIIFNEYTQLLVKYK